MLTGKQHVTLTVSSDLSLLGLQPVDRRVVKIKNTECGYGIAVRAHPVDGYAVIARVAPDGAAAATGQVFEGDFIEMANNQFVGGLTQEELVSILTEYDQVELVLIGNPDMDSSSEAAVANANARAIGAQEGVNGNGPLSTRISNHTVAQGTQDKQAVPSWGAKKKVR